MADAEALLTPEPFHELLVAERGLLDELIEIARAIEAQGEVVQAASTLRRHLEEPFLIVVVGEVKSGKSTVINELLGFAACAEGPTPVTDRIHILKYGSQDRQRTLEEHVVERELPVELLRDVCIVDTPGTNSILRNHSEITERFIPRCDLVLFLTSIDRPYSESEDRFLAQISDLWRKKVVFLVTKIDGREPAEVGEVVDYVRRMCLQHHGFEPVLLPVSAHAHRRGDDGGMASVRSMIRETLAGGEKIRLKLQSPLRSSIALVDSLEMTLRKRTDTLASDFRAVQDLDRQVEQAARDLLERAQRFVPRILDLFRGCEDRAQEFLKENLRIGRLGVFGRNESLKSSFASKVVGDLRDHFSKLVNEAVDWLMREEIALYEQSTQYLNEKVKPNPQASRLLTEEGTRFEYRRDQVFNGIAERYHGEIDTFNVPQEAEELVNAAHRGVTRQVGISALALAVGAGSIGLFASPLVHAIGLIAALGLGASGFSFLPAIRRHAARRFGAKLRRVADEVRRSFEQCLEKEISTTRDRLRKGWVPFLRFHRGESAELDNLVRRLAGARAGVADLDQRLSHLPTVTTTV